MLEEITIFPARKIITMSSSRPYATHVAVRDGRILGVGTLKELEGWGQYKINDRLRDKVIMPGLVEGHCHMMEGVMWRYPYIGYYDRRGPDGTLHLGLKNFDEVIARLQEAEGQLEDPEQPLFAWGLDPIYFGGERMTHEHLDRVSTQRPIVIMHISFHLMNVNSKVMELAGIDENTPVDGILKGADDRPTGELQEAAAMFLAMDVTDPDFTTVTGRPDAVWNFGKVAQLAGVTTATDLLNELPDATVDLYGKVTADDAYPVRLMPALAGLSLSPEAGVERIHELKNKNTDKLRFGLTKFITDGSIQGFTARVKQPGYYNGAPNGLWVTPPQQLQQYLSTYHRAGLQVHIHTNGNEASEVALDAIEQVQSQMPRWDHRHTLQHCQMADASQFRRMRNLGACVNLFANHIYYWGDAHYTQTMGPERAEGMDAMGTALAHGVHFAVHSDAPITPIGPLFSAWCAVNRQTASGRVLGVRERIGVADALYTITLGAAYTLKMDHEIGSIEAGKLADFAVLEDDPLEMAPEQLKDAHVWGTVLGGRVFQAGE